MNPETVKKAPKGVIAPGGTWKIYLVWKSVKGEHKKQHDSEQWKCPETKLTQMQGKDLPSQMVMYACCSMLGNKEKNKMNQATHKMMSHTVEIKNSDLMYIIMSTMQSSMPVAAEQTQWDASG